MTLPNTLRRLHRSLAAARLRPRASGPALLLSSIVVSAVLVSGCAHIDGGASARETAGAQLACPPVPGSDRWVRTELYFGLSKPDGSLIPEDAFRGFLDSEVTSRFPNGFTVLDGRGQFLSATGALVRESSKVLVLLYAFDDRTSGRVEEIRKAYRERFEQESVLRVDGGSCVSF